MMEHLLAKSYDKKKYGDSNSIPDYALLTKHTEDVAEAASTLLQIVGESAIYSADIEPSEWTNFQQSICLNARVQDIGKANSHFQRMLNNSHAPQQLARHEVVSVILFWRVPALRSWLSTLPEKVLLAGLWGALGHHRKFSENTESNGICIFTKMDLFATHPDVLYIMQGLAQSLKLPSPPQLTNDLTLTHRSMSSAEISVARFLSDIKEEFDEKEDLFDSRADKIFVLLVKAFGICADVCASAVAKNKFESYGSYSIRDYIKESLGSKGLSTVDFDNIINTSLNTVSTVQDSRSLFQDAVATSKADLTLAIGGCGSGKSIAAYRWGQQQCRQAEVDGRNNFRFFFCLPTTGTSTEHFKDYALESGIDAHHINLTHSRASIDLRTIATTTESEEAEDTKVGDAAHAARACLSATTQSIEALSWWSTPLVVTTADNVLGLMSNSRKAVCGLPAIMSGAVVFDECHAYDDEMFAHLLSFIQAFPKLPILLMTASMPPARRQILQKARPDLHLVPGPEDFEILPRYLLNYEQLDEVQLHERIHRCLETNGKILWVRNQVEWANETYHKCLEHFEQQAYINVYHSRLKYKHRSLRHRKVIDIFKQENTPILLVTTQVAEMSLNLSADLLITDLASIPALIQRMGRLNRINPLSPKEVLILPVKSNDHAPYSNEEITMGTKWVESLIKLNCPLSQRHLTEAFESIGNTYRECNASPENKIDLKLWETIPGLTRSQGYTTSVILEEDLITYKRTNPRDPDRTWIRNHEVSIPIRSNVASWRERVGFTPVAPSEEIVYHYDENTNMGVGAKWKP